MEENHIVQKVENCRWEQAQDFELNFARITIESDDDWNKWWFEKFDNYAILKKKHFPDILEVGCGPHTNIRYILPEVTFEKIWLEDPLIQFYITYNLNKSNSFLDCLKRKIKKGKVNYLVQLFSNINIKTDLSSSKLEDLPYKDKQMDLVICVNVLDHVSDYERCMSEIFRVLKKGGILILGQDLSNQEDRIQCPESYTDIGHPIKLDHLLIEGSLEGKYSKLFEKILTREKGRNPNAHYGTYLGILQKN
jgi:SAM-dependent methyltransferase